MSHDDAFVERLRRTYRSAGREAPGESTPSDDEIVDLVLGRLPSSDRDRVADAVVANPALARRVKELMEVHRESSRELAPSPLSNRGWGGWAAAASVVLVLGFAGWKGMHGTPGSEVLRGSTEDTAKFVPKDGALLTAPPGRLEWTGAEGATSYTAVLFDAESKPLWTSGETPRPSLELPEEARRLMTRPGVYYWRIRYRVGVEERTLPLVELRIGP